MPDNNYRVVVCEGGDQVGKADSFLYFSNKISELGISQTYSSFPIYASPFGGVIRMFLRQGLTDLKLSPIEELKAKMAIYALDRLQFMDILLSNEKYKETLIILDRSCFSNAVSIAYGLVNLVGVTQKEIDDLIDYAFSLEHFMVDRLNLNNCVIQVISEDNSWGNVRNEGQDINENSEVQMATTLIYDKFQHKIGKGWKKVVTKKQNGWRDRDEIFNDIYDFVNDRGVIPSQNDIKENLNINIQEVLDIYEGACVNDEDVEKYWNALKNNEKDVMHEYGIKVCLQISKSFRRMKFRNREVEDAFKEIVENNPQVLDVLKYFLGEEFGKKIVKSLNIDE